MRGDIRPHRGNQNGNDVMTCLIPEYAIGIRAFRVHTSDAFAQPRCFKNAMHGARMGEWHYQHGRRIILWERITP